MSVPSAQPYAFSIPPNPEVGVGSSTPVVALGAFDHNARNESGSYAEAVHSIVGGDEMHAPAFGRMVKELLAAQSHVPTPDLIVPMPDHDGGIPSVFDTISTHIDAPTHPMIRREVAVAPNKSLTEPGARWVNVAGSLTVQRSLDERTVLVVDDVVGSGASVGTAAKALREAGATSVGAVVLGVRVPTSFPLTPVG